MMTKLNSHSSRSGQQGVVLLETLIAILIFSMAVLALIGLQAAMIKNTSDAKFRADASHIAQQRIGAMWADPLNLGNYIEVQTPISTLIPNGTRTVAQIGPTEYQVTVTWQQPGETQHSFTTIANIVGGS